MKTEPVPVILKSSLLPVKHGFSTRHGGISPEPFNSLNLGGSEDTAENIAENRRIFLHALALDSKNVAWMKQVHGTDVFFAQPGVQTCDALVTAEPGITLAVNTADCYPLLFHDPVNHVIGVAHAGWRGTLGRIAAATINKMKELGAMPQFIHVVIGPGICGSNYEVSEEVLRQFSDAGFPNSIRNARLLDLALANQFVLEEAGILMLNIDVMHRCSTDTDFFSFRRDNGITGRMWSVISL
jgi:YfiH family protein